MMPRYPDSLGKTPRLSIWISSRAAHPLLRRRSLAGHQARDSHRHDKEVVHVPKRSRRGERNLGNQVTALAKNLRAAHRELARGGVLHFFQFESPRKGNVSSVKEKEAGSVSSPQRPLNPTATLNLERRGIS